MNFNEVINTCKTIITQKYVCFEGRSSRKEFWTFALTVMVIIAVLGIIPGIGKILSALLILAVLLPSIGLGIRRMHDIGKSGWFLLVNVIPFVGSLIYIILCCKAGDAGANAYGEDPKAVE